MGSVVQVRLVEKESGEENLGGQKLEKWEVAGTLVLEKVKELVSDRRYTSSKLGDLEMGTWGSSFLTNSTFFCVCWAKSVAESGVILGRRGFEEWGFGRQGWHVVLSAYLSLGIYDKTKLLDCIIFSHDAQGHDAGSEKAHSWIHPGFGFCQLANLKDRAAKEMRLFAMNWLRWAMEYNLDNHGSKNKKDLIGKYPPLIKKKCINKYIWF